MKQLSFSIITVVLNGADAIRKTIESVLQQKGSSEIEYIVIDGGSTDGTRAIIREYSGELAFWCSEKDEGISDAFNKGILHATGDVVGILNAGDWYAEDACEIVADAFDRNPDAGIVCGGLQYWRGQSREYCCESVPSLLDKDMSVTHPSCFVRRCLYDSFGLFRADFRYAMDYELLLRMQVNGVCFYACPETLANMQHDGVSELHWKEALRETQRARHELIPSCFTAGVIYYSFLFAKKYIRKILERLHMDLLLRIYREHFAFVKKRKLRKGQ